MRLCVHNVVAGCDACRAAANARQESARELERLRDRVRDLELELASFEPVGFQYRFPSYPGGHVWKDEPTPYNASSYDASREIFAKKKIP